MKTPGKTVPETRALERKNPVMSAREMAVSKQKAPWTMMSKTRSSLLHHIEMRNPQSAKTRVTVPEVAIARLGSKHC